MTGENKGISAIRNPSNRAIPVGIGALFALKPAMPSTVNGLADVSVPLRSIEGLISGLGDSGLVAE
ncbi:hypothetical protein IFM46972_10372 [Aspergillus udagawae]|uniref:Uncharacterized protein n=1 Tax=Aspergillus udagawae TaxID=91492 RepID=A0A8H3SC13_9EURO|nr:hypothetical protein IFM46972_10372 [Aspergillus udagawae]